MLAHVVVGTFDRKSGKKSKIGAQIAEYLGWQCINGGNIDLLNGSWNGVSPLLWMPNISNDEEKYLPQLKQNNPHMFLISSKNAVGRDFTESDMVGRLLKYRSNLGILIDKEDDRYVFKLMDPLGNIFVNTQDVEALCSALQKRLDFLKSLTRWPSINVGDWQEYTIPYKFTEIIRDFGDKFSEFVNAINPNRFLGNAATRCSSGFPCIRDGERIFVTRRNVDKTTLDASDFVEVMQGDKSVNYWGINKPSVDSPIQLKIFEKYKNVKYIIHGHVYVAGGGMTENKIPCGHIEEFDEVVDALPDEIENSVVNLKGHGCLILAQDLEFFDTITLKGRPFPEGTKNV